MNRSVLVVLVALFSCTPPPEEKETGTGWFSLPDEQANRSWGALNLSWTSATRLEGSLALTGTTPGRKLYLAVRWKNSAEPVVISAPFDSSFSVEVDPPAAVREPAYSRVCTGEGARGLLLVYLASSDAPDPAHDELVSVSEKPRELFSAMQALYSQPFAWDSCEGPRPVMPLLLQHDPRLRLALCAPDCGEPLFDRTHVVSAQVDLDAEGAAFSFEVLGREQAVVEVNGVLGGQWREGVNTVKVTAGALAPWSAKVGLPAKALHPQLRDGALRTGAPFTLDWRAPWATSAWLDLRPLDVPLLKVGDPSFVTEGESFTGIFPGFFDARGCVREVPRTSIEVRARLMDGPFGLSVLDSVAVPVL